ncbi:hypothetical protein ACHAW5_006839 [Stephanodiscus triporus]|uniref:Uncharacterized protein n=1 Tax=Stephanodiscus triporus TaxID=2934178 RepID=A0ABD3PYK2_9STRA
MPVTRTMARERPSLLPPPNARGKSSSATSSRYSLSNEELDELVQGFDGDEALTTSGRTYEELVSASQRQSQLSGTAGRSQPRDSEMSEETEDSEPSQNYGRQSVGVMLGRNLSSWSTGRNSLSNWSTIGGEKNAALNDNGDDDGGDDYTEKRIPNSVHLGNIMDTGRKSNVSHPSLGGGRNSLETPIDGNARHANISQRRSNHVSSRSTHRSNIVNARASRPSQMDHVGRYSSLNMSHISSSSSSGLLDASGEDLMLEDSWTPIRTSLEHSFDKSIANEATFPPNKANGCGTKTTLGLKISGSLSPIRGRSSKKLSPKKMPESSTSSSTKSPIKAKSPVRSPFGDVSPNCSPKKANSPKKGNATTSPKKKALSPKKKALSPNGTYSLKEAEGKLLSMPMATATTNIESGSGSSNMSVSSGSEATSSSATTLEQGASSSKKLVLQSLSSSRNDFKKSDMVPKNASLIFRGSGVVKATAQEGGEESSILSPEKISTKDHIRSPVPTPNSQRKVIKRFRASVPTASYLVQDDLMDDSLEKNSTRKEVAVVVEPANNIHGSEKIATANGGSSEAVKPMEVETTQSTYENAFVFPLNSIPSPRIKTLCMFHDQAVSNGSPSHQYQLNRAGANVVSLQEVILPSIAYETNSVLKQQQAKALRHAQDGMPVSQGKEIVEAIETCRKVVNKCTGEAMKVVGEEWREREKERQRLRVERFEREKEQQRLDDLNAKRERKEARARSRQDRYERQKTDKRLNHPRNKELWQEVAKLMVDIQKLEKEERLWKEALVEVNRLVEYHQPPEMIELDSIVKEKSSGKLLKSIEKVDLESLTTTLVGDVTMATERINWMLKSVTLAMEESDKLRKEAYNKYQYDGHKFWGYPKVDDSKGLFIALSMESPFKG